MPRALPPPSAAFSAREVRLLAALAPVLLPAGGGLARSHADVDWLSFAQRYAAEAPPQMRLLLKATLLLLGSLGWAWAGRWPERSTWKTSNLTPTCAPPSLPQKQTSPCPARRRTSRRWCATARLAPSR